MRDYSKISPRFWIGETGRKLRAAGANVQVVAMYLLTSPHANMLGLYYLPVVSLRHETGLTEPEADTALAKAKELCFCDYDEQAEMVWVYEMARFQVGDQLEPTDKRCRGIQKEYLALFDNRFLAGFFDKYATRFNLTTRRDQGKREAKDHARTSEAQTSELEAPSMPLASPTEAPSMPHRSHKHKHEHEHEVNLPIADAMGVAGEADPLAIPAEIPAIPNCPHEQIVELYHETLSACPRIREWTDTRRAYLRARWKEKAKPNGVSQGYTTVEDGLAWWRKFFDWVAESQFLTGRATGRGDTRPFVADLEWLVKPSNFVKVIEGKYHDAAA